MIRFGKLCCFLNIATSLRLKGRESIALESHCWRLGGLLGRWGMALLAEPFRLVVYELLVVAEEYVSDPNKK
jgi:hypothetical protein